MYCPECGKQINDSSKFCRYCGHHIAGGIPKERKINNSESVPKSQANVEEGFDDQLSFIQANPLMVGFGILICVVLFAVLYFIFSSGGSDSNRQTVSEETKVTIPVPPPFSSPSPPPSPQYPNVSSAIDVLFEGESLTESGKYSHDQRKELFNRNYKDKIYAVSGKIITVGKAAFTDRKYITIEAKSGHFFDVYPSFDFDLLKYSKDSHVSFIGEWTELGTGIMFPHTIDNAEEH